MTIPGSASWRAGRAGHRPQRLQLFQGALARYGTPEEVLTDNGKVFTGRLGPHPAMDTGAIIPGPAHE